MRAHLSRCKSESLNPVRPAAWLATTSASHRRGIQLMVCLVVMIPVLGLAALAIDLGRLHVMRSEVQRSADGAAMAATPQLLHADRLKPAPSSTVGIKNARDKAVSYAGRNYVENRAPLVDRNDSNDSNGEVVIGYLADPKNQSSDMTFVDPNKFNSVRVRVQRSSQRNGSVPLLLASVLGISSAELKLSATATIQDRVRGFKVTDTTGNAKVLPIKLNVTTWAQLFTSGAPDNYRWDEATQSVVSGSDGIKEVEFFPDSDVPGNDGYLDIGSPDNGNDDLVRQIIQGVSASDLAYLGGQLALNNDGTLQLAGIPGLRSSVLAALATVVGQTRIIPLYSTTTGSGSNSVVTIVGFAGIRIMHVNTSGSDRIVIQPAHVIDDTAIIGDGPTQSKFVYAALQLSR